MVGDLSLLAVASASPVVLPPSKVRDARRPYPSPRTEIPCQTSRTGAAVGQFPVPVGRGAGRQFLIASRWLTSCVFGSLWLTDS